MADGDGKRVKSTLSMSNGSTTTYFVGGHYEVANGVITKYYYAGAQRIALRQNGTLNYILGDHLGSTSLVVDAVGVIVSETRYKAWGEVRYSSGTLPTKYTYTGQYTYTGDFGLMFYQSRFYDPQLGRFSSPDSIIPEQTQGVQAWDHYAYTNNNPVRYTDPTGHCILCYTAAVVGGVLLGAYIYSHYIHEPSRPADGNASNVWELAYLGYEHAEHANIVGEGLQNLQSQISLQGEQDKIIEEIRDDPRYGEESFSPPKITQDFTANGPTGKWYLALNEPAFWMAHTGRISATNIKVSEDGTISTTWKVTDTFDYKPRWEKGILHPYNLFAVPMYFLYNVIGGAKEKLPINAYWNETIPPPPYSCGKCE